ncbi:MAG: class I SAM-dependent methyltransferase [Magnetococcales bacterium]|nr:class I SAM-dependent methyltransferase [Magnetococcales bacterium]MBF0150206.1 class I SAM-dependent methyltransferase [Magnetococcales bacterium]MBF0174782.1 class I SAM-dependent methyltransferase [Magnetococcales bacterium]MBF0347906.1 class I SAM-dependent methyltransferase [Magnetococcales bacterium]MBF0631900.1 class I SAM-dependent methyltransferase [Magnetococcales bacterium]
MPTLILNPGRDKSLRRHHPWIFSGAVARIEGTPTPGETIAIVDAKGNTLARGAFSGHSQIVSRIWSFHPDEAIDATFFHHRLQRSLERRHIRSPLPDSDNTALRLVNAESDGLAGVTIDRYGPWLVGQFTSAGAQRWKKTIAEILLEMTGAHGLLERTDGEVCAQEGVPESVGPLLGATPPERIPICEHGLTYAVDPWHGHKTGFYLDQKDNRLLIREGSHGMRVLNTFAFSGGFGLNAMAAGAAQVVHLDSSSTLLAQAEENARLSNLPADRFEYCKGNAFHKLREWRDQHRTFDVIVLDPPKLADSQAGLQRAARAYKDLNWLAFRLLARGGRLLTFSCSGRMPADLFAKVVADAAVDAGREALIQRYLGPPADHPVALAFPEGRYLKGLLCAVD